MFGGARYREQLAECCPKLETTVFLETTRSVSLLTQKKQHKNKTTTTKRPTTLRSVKPWCFWEGGLRWWFLNCLRTAMLELNSLWLIFQGPCSHHSHLRVPHQQILPCIKSICNILEIIMPSSFYLRAPKSLCTSNITIWWHLLNSRPMNFHTGDKIN